MGGLRSSPKHESRVEYLVKLNIHRAAVMHEAVRKFEEGLVMAKKERKYDAKYFVKVIIGFIIVWCFGLLPAPEPMTAVGMRLIGIFFGTIWLFSFAGVIWPSIMAVLAVGYSGAFPMPKRCNHRSIWKYHPLAAPHLDADLRGYLPERGNAENRRLAPITTICKGKPMPDYVCVVLGHANRRHTHQCNGCNAHHVRPSRHLARHDWI